MEASVFEDLLGVLAEERRLDLQAVRTEALRLYLNVNPSLKLDGVVLLWSKGRLSLTTAAEIAGLTVPELQQVLASRGTSQKATSESSQGVSEISTSWLGSYRVSGRIVGDIIAPASDESPWEVLQK